MAVVISGIEILCCLGTNKEEVFQKIIAGAGGIKEYPLSLGKIGDNCMTNNRVPFSSADAANDYLFECAIGAIKDAGLTIEDLQRNKVGLVIGTSLGGMRVGELFYQAILKNSKPNLKLKKLFNYPIYAPVDYLCSHLPVNGPSLCVSTACSSGQVAISIGYELINSGRCNIVITGGVDVLCEISVAGFASLKALSSHACSPFSNTSPGLSLGEGVAVLILEDLQNAQLRRSRPYAEVCGYGISADAYHPTAPDPTGAGIIRAIKNALKDAGVEPEEVEYINAHGTGTPSNDIAETLGVKRCFRNNWQGLYMSSIKGAIGHTLGAAGAIECAITTLSLYYGVIPPTINFSTPRPGCDMNYVPNHSLNRTINIAISNSFAFGGNNSSIIFRRKIQPPNYKRHHGMEDERIVITGIGLITPLGSDKEIVWTTIKQGKSAITQFEGVADFYNRVIATQRGMVADDYLNSMQLRYRRKMDRLSLLSSIAAKAAIKDANLQIDHKNSDDIGICFGTGTGSLSTIEEFYRKIVVKGDKLGDAALFPNTVLNAPVGYITLETGIKGPNITLGRGRLSFLHALFVGCCWLKRHRARAILCGSGDEYSEILHKSFLSLRLAACSRNSYAMLNKNEKGFIPGEGAIFFVLETLKHALQRNARIYGEIADFAFGEDGFSSDGKGMIQAIEGINFHNPDIIFTSISGGLARDFREFYGIRKKFDGLIPKMLSLAPIFGEMPSTLTGINLFAALKVFEENFLPANVVLDSLSNTNTCEVKNILITANDFVSSSGAFLVKRPNGR